MKRLITLLFIAALGLSAGCATSPNRPSNIWRAVPGGNSYIAKYDADKARGEWATAQVAAARVDGNAQAGIDVVELWDAFKEKDTQRLWALAKDGLVAAAWVGALALADEEFNSSPSRPPNRTITAADALHADAVKDTNVVHGSNNVFKDVSQLRNFNVTGDGNTFDFQQDSF